MEYNALHFFMLREITEYNASPKRVGVVITILRHCFNSLEKFKPRYKFVATITGGGGGGNAWGAFVKYDVDPVAGAAGGLG